MEATSEICGGSLQKLYGGTLRLSTDLLPVSTPSPATETLLARPKRADARRNYEKVLAAAREAFAEGGESTALEQIARRAGVGIGTLYRHFPTRQALLEALYVDEVDEVCRTAADLDNADPWEALSGWFERFIGYIATKQALVHELLNYLDRDAQLFKVCRASLFEAGEPLLRRAQEAGVVRPDVGIADVIQMVMGIAKVPAGDPAQTQHILRIALDGLRYRPEA
jgi:AcrR family transcriptional regulator